MRKIVLVFAFLTLVTSCVDDGSQSTRDDNSGRSLKETADPISADNLKSLKKQCLEEFNEAKLNVMFEDPGFDIQQANKKLEPFSSKEAENLDFQTVLGENYNGVYFDNLNRFLAFTTKIYNSPLFDKDSSLESRELIVGEILEFVFDSSQGLPNATYACGPGYGPCMRKAEKDHKLRMASYSASAGLAMALAGWTGVGAAGAAGGWVIAMISSGAQYQIDIEYCEEANCT